MNNGQRGFTLIEIVIALGIVGVISSGVTASISQIFTLRARTTSHMIAVSDVENAVHWITDDAQMAQSLSSLAPSGFPLTLNWVEWNGNSDSAAYSVVNGRLTRSYSVNGGQPTVTVVVAHMNSAQTSCTVTSQALNFEITSTAGSGSAVESETRSFEIVPSCAPIAVNVIPPLVIATGNLPNGYAGAVYSQPLAATGGVTPYNWSLTGGALPAGLSLSSGGVISGTPTTAGSSTFTVQVTDSMSPSASTATQTLALYVNAALSITTTLLPGGQVGVAYSQTLAATGGISPYTWSISGGSLPAGLSLNSSTGTISGTPTASGAPSFTIKATDSASHTATQPLSITITALSVTTTSLPAGFVNAAYSQTLAATGGTSPYTWSISVGSLPAGLSLNSSAGAISGTPTTTGTSSFTVKVTDSASPTHQTATQALSITIKAALAITTSSLASGQVGVTYSQTLAATGGTSPYTWTISVGALPTGLAVSSGGVISGMPTAAGTFNFTVRATDSASPTANNATKALSITIGPGVYITTASLPTGYVGVAYSQTLGASGGTTPYTWTITSGSLPAGLSLNSSTGTISGTPTTSGAPSFTVKVADSASHSSTKTLSITVNAGLAITTASLPGGQIGVAYSQTLAATGGGGAYTWSISGGSLPAGLSLSSSSGIISGTPTAAGTSSFTAKVTDSASPTPNTATKALSITIITPLAITTTSLPNGFVGVAYSQTVAATGGTTPYTWSISVGSLPSGLSLNSSTGTISGTPTAAGTSSFTVQVTDSTSPTHNTVTQALSITVPAPPAVTTNSATSVVQTSATLNGTLTALGASGSATLSFDWGTSTSYAGGNVAANPSSWNGGVPKAFTYNLTGLTHNTTYHYRAKAVGADGSIVYGSDKTFTTPW